ncbi:thymidine kinase 2, mitochondrial-like isoform X1 [Ostrea edulis]|uniref:thymidine kinase 2, mitochondrial-like isoform X1 n=1 Tax=Ostrea edulis TaxID=37623 RepID=UPI0020944AED|nr:thymidine kinase 2, mitochondrial-like isoform X1 [Ostrea edulis]XP_048762724.1 thymidine kinase 2, mitochondrial-like isoform X1 [Ostrea edulis]
MALSGLIANQRTRRILAVYSPVVCNICAKSLQVDNRWRTERSYSQLKMLGAEQIKRITEKVFQDENIRRIMPKGKLFTVSVEGNIGSGKTTLLEYFQNSPNVEAIREPVEQWTNVQGHNALQLLYEDPKRWSFTFNLYAQLTRIQMHARETDKPVKLLERSLHSTRYCFVENCFREQVINGLEYTILNRWFDYLTKKDNTQLDLIVYLRADPDVCYERIRSRDRKEEASVPKKLIKDLHDLHEEWLVQQRFYKAPAPVLVLDANCEYREMTELYETRREEILCGYV